MSQFRIARNGSLEKSAGAAVTLGLAACGNGTTTAGAVPSIADAQNTTDVNRTHPEECARLETTPV